MPKLLTACAFSLAFHVLAAIPVSSIRQPGSSLDPSIQNEVDHAARQAALWLCARQRPDGAWGDTTNRFRLTALSLLALAAADTREHSDACSRAVLWLDARATNRVEALEAHAWHLIALTRLVPDSPARTNLLARYSRFARPAAVRQASPSVRRLWSQALSAAGVADPYPIPEEPRDDDLARLAETWPGCANGNAAMWRIARLINARSDGQLMRGHRPLDWRRDLAQILINSLRCAPAGGGYWNAPTGDGQIEETAFALLTLLEL